MRNTHTVVELPLSPEAYKEIADALGKAGYAHAFLPDCCIDMTGIAVVEDRSRTHGVAFLAELIQQRAERIGSYDQVPAGGVWIDRGLRMTGNTTRMCRAAIATAAKGVKCVLVFPVAVHAECGQRTIDDLLREMYLGPALIIIDGEQHSIDAIRSRIRIVTLTQFNEKVAGTKDIAIFPDGSLVSTLINARFPS